MEIHTTEQLDAMSHFEINKVIANINDIPIASISADNGKDWEVLNCKTRSTINYCNNWADIGPLIQLMISQKGYMMRSTSEGTYTRVIWQDAACTDENALRANAIVYILVMQERAS